MTTLQIDMKRVMAQGVFDILHPGHLYYLSESAKKGDELYVVIARDSRIEGKKNIFFRESERREIIESMEMVDCAKLGSEGNLFDSVEKICPDIITIGHDQEFDIDILKHQLEKSGFENIEIVRIPEYKREGLKSSSEMKEKIKNLNGNDSFISVVKNENQ